MHTSNVGPFGFKALPIKTSYRTTFTTQTDIYQRTVIVYY